MAYSKHTGVQIQIEKKGRENSREEIFLWNKVSWGSAFGSGVIKDSLIFHFGTV